MNDFQQTDSEDNARTEQICLFDANVPLDGGTIDFADWWNNPLDRSRITDSDILKQLLFPSREAKRRRKTRKNKGGL